jgi:hypothetical protein
MAKSSMVASTIPKALFVTEIGMLPVAAWIDKRHLLDYALIDVDYCLFLKEGI